MNIQIDKNLISAIIEDKRLCYSIFMQKKSDLINSLIAEPQDLTKIIQKNPFILDFLYQNNDFLNALKDDVFLKEIIKINENPILNNYISKNFFLKKENVEYIIKYSNHKNKYDLKELNSLLKNDENLLNLFLMSDMKAKNIAMFDTNLLLKSENIFNILEKKKESFNFIDSVKINKNDTIKIITKYPNFYLLSSFKENKKIIFHTIDTLLKFKKFLKQKKLTEICNLNDILNTIKPNIQNDYKYLLKLIKISPILTINNLGEQFEKNKYLKWEYLKQLRFDIQNVEKDNLYQENLKKVKILFKNENLFKKIENNYINEIKNNNQKNKI